MNVSRADPLRDGRINQKRRTRSAIVDAARELMSEGVTPTVQQAAERGLVSRTTAYRYFPTQESLLLEVAMNVDVDDIELIVARPVDLESVEQRIGEVLDTFNRHVFAEETQYRTSMRLYLDLWLAAGDTDESPIVREGRRQRWIATTLDPLRVTLESAEFDRLVAALCVVAGSEAMVVLRDVCGLDSGAALEVSAWAVSSLVRTALEDRTTG